jgi:hypothetical protein
MREAGIFSQPVISTNEVRRNLTPVKDKISRFARNDDKGFGVGGKRSGESPLTPNLIPRTPYSRFLASLEMTGVSSK